MAAWDGNRNAILPSFTPKSTLPAPTQTKTKAIGPRTISKNSLGSASLALALGHGMARAMCGL